MLLHFFKLRETFFNVLIELCLYLIGDGKQPGIDANADSFQRLSRALIEIIDFGFELGSGERQRAGHFSPCRSKILGLLTAPAG